MTASSALPDVRLSERTARAWTARYEADALRLTVVADTDVDDSSVNDVQNLAAIAQHAGPCPAAPAACPWDLTGDGDVDQQDIQLRHDSI